MAIRGDRAGRRPNAPAVWGIAGCREEEGSRPFWIWVSKKDELGYHVTGYEQWY
jgi:hypothetical protein